jgi:hypothetical protein
MPGLSFYDKQHIQKVAAQQAVIANIFNQFILSVSPYLRKWSDAGKNNVWIQNRSIENAVDKELLTLESLLIKNIESFQFDAWKRSDMKNDDFIREYIKGMSISSVAKEGMFTHSMSAFSAFQKEVDAQGLRLSDRVWNIAQQTKSQLEFYLDSGIAAGRSSNEISRNMRQLLDKPDKRFRRVRNDEGKLVLSRPMKDYHPGQGVYRSAKMNALRTSATTTNIAYRSADYERWSKQDFVLGIEIQRSANNRGPCKICDAMVGKYPKTFKFTGFHPFCICFATPIVMEPDNLADFLLNDTVPHEQIITDIPQKAKDFVSENKDGLQSAFWYKDNFTKDGDINERIKIAIKPEKPQQLVIEPKYTFKESKSIEEAQEFARQFCQKNMLDRTFKGEINYKGISVDNANEINKVLADVFNQLDMPKISGIKVISPTSVQGKKAFSDGVDAVASYSPVDGGIFLNKDILKSPKAFAEYMQKSQDAWSKVMENIDRLTPAQRAIAMRYKEAGRSLVDETLQGCIRHEIGHHVQWKMLPTNLNNELGKEMSLYASKISGYATSSKSEYLAESFVAYMRGEKANIDPKLVEFLDSKFVSNSVVKIVPKKIKRIKTDIEKNDIQKRWDERFVRNFNQTKIEQKIGIKRGEEMTFEEANELRGNINFGKGNEYGVNCQSCVVANELRRRGYDVTALPNLEKKGNIPHELSKRTNWVWIDPKTMVMPEKKTAGGIYDITRTGALKSKSIKELTKELVELVKEPGRYHIDFSWKGRNSGHIITLEKSLDGKIVIYDPQTGKIKNWGELSKEISLKYGVNVLRVDNLLVNTDIINGIVKKL